MTNHKFHRPLAAMVALLGIASFAVIACGDDDDNGGTTDIPDAGKKDANVGDSGDSTSDAGDASTDEYTVDVGAGYATACALSNKGHVKCWGDAVDGEMLSASAPGKQCFDDGELLDCDHRTPTDLTIPYPVEQLEVGYLSVCVIANDSGTRKLGCWGSTFRGQLSSYAPDSGIATTISWITLPAEPKRIISGREFKLVELADGSLWAWGDNRFGQFGGANLDISPTPEKVWPPAITQPGADAGAIVDIATQYLGSFVATAGGIYFSGDNESGEAQGISDEEVHGWTKLQSARKTPDGGAVADAGGDPIAKLFSTNGRAGGACFITAGGTTYCWGDNGNGQNGAASNELVDPVLTPTQIDLPAGRKATKIVIATGGICAITDDAAVYCWGDNTRGAAAQEPPQDYMYTPRLVPGVTGAQALAVGTNFFACAVTGEHKTLCWGDNGYGQRGATPDGGDSQYSSTPSEVPLTW